MKALMKMEEDAAKHCDFTTFSQEAPLSDMKCSTASLKGLQKLTFAMSVAPWSCC